MKLLGCHIANFGTFHDYDLTFNEGLNIVLQANGWGKTTLAAFVKAMLYGFDGKRVRNVAENERLRYRPWQGGRYGGSLDFEADGREYRVIRTFGVTGSRDTVKVLYIDTGKSAMSETGPNVGEWLFGLDANAFRKSVFVVQNGFGLSASNAGLRNRLNTLINEADDVAGFDKAQLRLEERRKYYKKTGNRGAIADVSRDIAKLVEADAKAESKVAELRRIEDEVVSLTSSIGVLDKEIVDVQETAERDQEAMQRARALRRVGDQLESRKREAQETYERAIREFGGVLPSSAEITRIRQSLADLDRLEEEASRAQAAAESAAVRGKALAAKYPAGLPQKGELEAKRQEVASLRVQEKAFNASIPEPDESFERQRAVLSSDPQIIPRAKDAVAKLGHMRRLEADGRSATRELQVARATWAEKRKRIARLASEYEEKRAAVPEDAAEQAEELRHAASELRTLNEKSTALGARYDALATRVEEEQQKLEALPGGKTQDDSAVELLDTATMTCAKAVEAVNEARTEEDRCALRLRELEKAEREARARVDEERASAQQAKPGLPIPAFACFVAAVAAAGAGVALGPVMFAVGAVLAVVGVVLLMRGKETVPAGPSDESLQAASEAADALSAGKAEYDLAVACLEKAEHDSREAGDQLVRVAEGIFPGEQFDRTTISAQVPVLKERLAAWPVQAKQVEELRKQYAAAEYELEEVWEQADAIMEQHTDLAGDDYVRKAAAMEARANELESVEAAANESREQLVAAIAEETGAETEALDDADVASFLTLFDQENPPEAEALQARKQKAQEASAAYASELNSLLASFGIGAVGVSELSVGAERLSKAVSAYRDALSKHEAAQRRQSAQKRQLTVKRDRITAWASKMGVDGVHALSDEWFDSVATDLSAAEKAEWEERRIRREALKAQKSLERVRANVNSFFAKHGIRNTSNPNDALNNLVDRANSIADLKKASEYAESELKQWAAEHSEALKLAKESRGSALPNDSVRRLEMLRQQRDSLVKEKARCEEQRNAVLESLENRLVVRQELELLSKRKQMATSNLFTVQKTAEYLRRAREGLDGRYLGDLADRFSTYANTWLEGEEIEAKVGPDFTVALIEGRTAHDVAGYSTGYQDLLDMCFRMALVDTVFQAQAPFLIMDDPFASLDAEKIGNAFLLLQALARKYQIIYFTCHPSRTEDGAANGKQVAFVLPEQQDRRELPRARAKREAEERAKAQAELVASYTVVPVTRNRASIAPSGKRHSINSNLFNVKFVVDNATGTGDNSFEVHFIDSKGRALCDRQTVEVIGGRTVPDKVRFSLATHDDSGSTYDMVIHEDGREPAELAARIPYKSEVSFATDDFGFGQ